MLSIPTASERRTAILQALQEVPSATAQEIADTMTVAYSTVADDLNIMRAEGKVCHNGRKPRTWAAGQTFPPPPPEHGQHDAQIMGLLAVHSNGASSKELAAYMQRAPERVRSRLQALQETGKIISFRDPLNMHQMLWALPQPHLTPSPPLQRMSRKTGARTR